MGRKTKERFATAPAQLAEIGESAQVFDLVRPNIEQDDIGPFESHLSCLNEENSHPLSGRENLRPIEYRVVQCDRERAEAEARGAFQQLASGIIEPILRVLEGVNVQIEFHPLSLLLLLLLH